MQPPVVLSIAGSDSGGGAGIQADIRTISALGGFATTAITAITAQNTVGVSDVFPLPAERVAHQIEAVLSDFTVKATKTGMLANPEIIHAVADYVRNGAITTLVVDPVMISSTRHALLGPGGLEAYRDDLLAVAHVVTPNLVEAAALIGADVLELADEAAMGDAARSIARFGVDAVLVKGGHLRHHDANSEVPDVLLTADGVIHTFRGPRIDTLNDHGTGCTLSAALATHLALGDDLPTAVRSAKEYVARALAGGSQWRLGAGHGPLDHFGARP